MSRVNMGAHIRKRLHSYTGLSVSERFRQKRWHDLLRRFPDLGDMRVIDLGGTTWDWTEGYWRTVATATSKPFAPKEVLVVNLDESALRYPAPWTRTLAADVCDLPEDILTTGFDLVFSNSLIEHVGGHFRRMAMADAIQRLADHHWVQTPSRYFPIEPHWMFPCFQFLPASARAAISPRWPLSPPEMRGQSKGQALDEVLGIELVSMSEMRRLFPTSELHRERFVGWTKSIVAIRP
jgi:hypothetical protein